MRPKSYRVQLKCCRNCRYYFNSYCTKNIDKDILLNFDDPNWENVAMENSVYGGAFCDEFEYKD